jgi:hypothetical protein
MSFELLKQINVCPYYFSIGIQNKHIITLIHFQEEHWNKRVKRRNISPAPKN